MRGPAFLIALALSLAAVPAGAQAPSNGPILEAADNGGPARLLRQPTISATQIAFMYGNDIWIVGRDGGEAKRVTSFPGQETNPQFSPDGQWLAFSAQYGGSADACDRTDPRGRQ